MCSSKAVNKADDDNIESVIEIPMGFIASKKAIQWNEIKNPARKSLKTSFDLALIPFFLKSKNKSLKTLKQLAFYTKPMKWNQY